MGIYQRVKEQEIKDYYQRLDDLEVKYSEPQKVEFPNLVNAPEHYDNSKGSLYKWCEEKGLNAYEFDIIKRVMRCRKKGQFIEDIDKTIELLKLYKNEFK